jgi:hypothetical protein
MKKKLTRKFAKRKAVHDRKIKKNYTMRKCMMCENNFKSSWIGNRICNPCKSTDYWKTGNDYSIMEQ